MYLSIGDEFPSMVLKGLTANKTFDDVDVTSVEGWKVIYFYPKDFTFVCPTEIVDFDNLVVEFGKLNTTVFGISPDNEYCKLAWREQHPQLKDLNHTLLADSGNNLAGELGIISSEHVPYRVTYILNSENTIQYVGIHGLSVGRSAAEVLRLVDSCQRGEEGMLCPAARPVGGATL
jgi:alkyl hydroperoxide reductase subunit AhpC